MQRGELAAYIGATAGLAPAALCQVIADYLAFFGAFSQPLVSRFRSLLVSFLFRCVCICVEFRLGTYNLKWFRGEKLDHLLQSPSFLGALSLGHIWCLQEIVINTETDNNLSRFLRCLRQVSGRQYAIVNSWSGGKSLWGLAILYDRESFELISQREAITEEYRLLIAKFKVCSQT